MDRSVRRIVTGTNGDGRETIVSDMRIAPETIALMPGAAFLDIWGGDAAPALPNDGSEPPHRTWFPPPGGFRVQMITIPPAGPPPADMAAAIEEANAKLPGLLDHLDPDHPGMHRTDTVDIVQVISGRCVLLLSSGARTELGPGDIVVQNGTRHAWQVPDDAPCTVLSISLGVPRAA